MAVNTVWTVNPAGLNAALGYTQTHVERAPDAAGVPGAFTEIAIATIDTSDEFTAYMDTGGATDSWYRYRWRIGTAGSFSGYDGSGVQVGTNAVKTSLIRNLPDADITSPFWDDWIAFALIDLFAKGIWKLSSIDITPTTSGGQTATSYAIASAIRDVTNIEARSTATGNPLVMTIEQGSEWEQRGRNVFIKGADTAYIYRVWGKARYTAVGEMTDDFFKLLYDMVRVRYFEFRENGRGNYRAYIVLDRNADITPEQLSTFRREAEQKVAQSIAQLSLGEPAVAIDMGGYR